MGCVTLRTQLPLYSSKKHLTMDINKKAWFRRNYDEWVHHGEQTVQKKLPDLIWGTTANRRRPIFTVYNKIQKKVHSSVHLSAGPQTCPDFKMERQMSLTNSQLMEWTHRGIYRRKGSGSSIRSLKYEPGLWAILRCALSSLACGGIKQLVVILPLALQLICSEWPLSQTAGKLKTWKKWKDSVKVFTLKYWWPVKGIEMCIVSVKMQHSCEKQPCQNVQEKIMKSHLQNLI